METPTTIIEANGAENQSSDLHFHFKMSTQVKLIEDYYVKEGKDLNSLTNEQVVGWIQNFAEKFCRIIESGERDKEKIRKILYKV